MPIAQTDSGTQAAVIGTEHSLVTKTDARTYVLVVDLLNMATADILELRVKIKVLAAGAARLYRLATYSHAQIEPAFISLPIPAAHSVEFTLKQTGGIGRNFDWSVVRID